MTKVLTAASCVSRQHPPFVWISDALLSDSFSRFCRQKRHGSNVPGPLEAQRRAAKRKNTSLAHPSHGTTSIDPVAVFGSSRNVEWWQAPTHAEPEIREYRIGKAYESHSDIVAALPPPRLLPSWLFPPSQIEAESPPSADSKIFPWEHFTGQTREEQLAQCSSIPEIHDWLQEEGIVLQDNPAIGAMVQAHVLQADFHASAISTYICDPALHPPGTCYIADLLPGLLDRIWDIQSWGLLRGSFCKAAELGLIGIDGLQTILSYAADEGVVRLRKSDDEVVTVKYREGLLLIRGILQSLDRSRVLRVADLGSKFMSDLFSKLAIITKSGACSKSSGLLWDILPWALEADAPVLRQLILRHLRNSCRDDAHEQVGQTLADRLAGANPAVLRLAILQTTENLIAFARESPTRVYQYLFYHWAGALETLGSTEKMLLTKDDWIQYQQLTINNPSPDSRLLAFVWTSFCLDRKTRRSQALSDRLRSLDNLEKTLKTIPEFVAAGFLDRPAITLDSLPLPHKKALLRDLTRCARPGGTHVSPGTSITDMEGLLRRSMTILVDENMYEHAQLECNDAVAELAECLSYNLPLFKALSRRLIRKSRMYFDVVYRMLENNTSFKLALSQTIPRGRDYLQRRALAQDHAAPLDPTGQDQPGGGNSDLVGSQPGDRSLPRPEQVLDLINHVAVSFATSSVAGPREALSRVYWCYLFLHRYGGSIEPPITQALWHTAVTRYAQHGYGEHGTANTPLRWVLGQIKMVEGEYVATRLLWSQTFRDQRRQEFQKLAGTDGDEDKPPLDRLDEAATKTRQTTQDSNRLSKLARDDRDVLLGELCDTTRSESQTPPGCGTDAVSEDLEILQKIRHVKADADEVPFWHEKAARTSSWQRRQRQQPRDVAEMEAVHTDT